MFFIETAIISFYSLVAKPLILGQIWGHLNERELNELSNVLFCGTVALLVPELYADLPKKKNVEKGQIRPLMIFGDLTFDLTKNDESSFVMTVDTIRMPLTVCHCVAKEPS